MKTHFSKAIKLTFLLIVLTVIYTLVIRGISYLAPGGGDGEKVVNKGNIIGYYNIGQSFTNDKYFRSRPSAVNYNAAAGAGSNKSPTNPDQIKIIKARIDTFLVHNPDISIKDIPSELVTASGSGLDPDISPQAAYIQVKRIAKIRKIDENILKTLVEHHIDKPLFGLFGPEKVNVLKLNIALEEMKCNK
ncbi:MAG: K(+)-transporting ATPase subunit C [Bacteroidota bacterium]|nr:K(+)-transporting ATPase subunit C [Bacteroidota bacterium]